MFGFGNNNYDDQPEEPSFLGKIGSFIWSAVKWVLAIAAIVTGLALFSDTARGWLDNIKIGKDKKGLGSAIRGKIDELTGGGGTKTTNAVHTVENSALELADKVTGGKYELDKKYHNNMQELPPEEIKYATDEGPLVPNEHRKLGTIKTLGLWTAEAVGATGAIRAARRWINPSAAKMADKAVALAEGTGSAELQEAAELAQRHANDLKDAQAIKKESGLFSSDRAEAKQEIADSSKKAQEAAKEARAVAKETVTKLKAELAGLKDKAKEAAELAKAAKKAGKGTETAIKAAEESAKASAEVVAAAARLSKASKTARALAKLEKVAVLARPLGFLKPVLKVMGPVAGVANVAFDAPHAINEFRDGHTLSGLTETAGSGLESYGMVAKNPVLFLGGMITKDFHASYNALVHGDTNTPRSMITSAIGESKILGLGKSVDERVEGAFSYMMGSTEGQLKDKADKESAERDKAFHQRYDRLAEADKEKIAELKQRAVELGGGRSKIDDLAIYQVFEHQQLSPGATPKVDKNAGNKKQPQQPQNTK